MNVESPVAVEIGLHQRLPEAGWFLKDLSTFRVRQCHVVDCFDVRCLAQLLDTRDEAFGSRVEDVRREFLVVLRAPLLRFKTSRGRVPLRFAVGNEP